MTIHKLPWLILFDSKIKNNSSNNHVNDWCKNESKSLVKRNNKCKRNKKYKKVFLEKDLGLCCFASFNQGQADWKKKGTLISN